MRARLSETVSRLAGAAGGGFSVTMGAGGSTRRGTPETDVEIADGTDRPVVAHLTALGLTREEVMETAGTFPEAGITRILALRGDTPRAALGPLPEGFAHASDVVAALAARHPCRITVAAYPEKHPEAATLDVDIDHLKAKIDAGATSAICQFVLDAEAHGRFPEACGRRGIDVPVVPGLMPFPDWPRIHGFARANAAGIPGGLDDMLSSVSEAAEIAPSWVSPPRWRRRGA